MLTVTQRVSAPSVEPELFYTLALSAEERTRSRHRFTTLEGQEVKLQLPRGTVLRDRDWLGDHSDRPLVRVAAKPEAVLTVTAAHPLDLLRAAYHLGNRHISLEITEHYLRLPPDSVLKDMLHHLGLHVHEEVLPFQPEAGAYGHSHHTHA